MITRGKEVHSNEKTDPDCSIYASVIPFLFYTTLGKDEEGEKRGEMKRGEDKKTNRRKDEKGGKRE